MLNAVVLAGGKSERLAGIVPPYHKPFLVINGRALVVAAVEDALDAGAYRVVVVATGENALPVSQLVGHIPQVRIILAAGGPGRALRAGLEMCQTQRVLVLMSDNVHGPGDVGRVCDTQFGIGVRDMSHTDARRFTRRVGGRWVEGDAASEPGHAVGGVTVWCGPLVIDRDYGLLALTDSEKIGSQLGDLAPAFELIPVSTVDAGTPDVVRQLT